MPSDYEQICKDNIRRRGEEFDDIGRLISEQLYSDRTHFIYELLQNAEDALGRRKRNNPESELPTNVKFLLYKDRLEFRHFGENFNTNDVKGISDVLKGTKSEDKTQIGKFGIGFKSVYAFTSTPEIHSGDEHFIIERYIRPRSADRIPQIADGETVFVFPFNHKDLSKEQAFQLIEEKLKKIGSRVLLFLRNITEIEWKIEDQEEGLYLKESKQQGRFAQRVTVIGQHGNEDEEEEWLVFRRQIEIVNSSAEGFVEVAFRLIENKKEEKKIIRRIESSPLVVYFPTKLETRFGFLVHGPYDTTASRSDIEDNEWNRYLIMETALLLTDHVLPTLKQTGLLTVRFLEALPIRMDDFPEDGMFYPIVEAVRDALLDQELLPTDDETFVSARNAKLARGAELRNLLTHDQLRELFQSDDDIRWLSGEITQDRTPDLRSYLMSELDVEEIRPETFIELLTDEYLQAQTDTWIIQFYNFLGNDRSKLWKKPDSVLRKKKILRLENNYHVIPFLGDGRPSAYLPSSSKTNFPTIKKNIFEDIGSANFLRSLGLFEPDLFAEVIEFVLPKYSEGSFQGDFQENIEDLRKINKVLNTPLHDNSQNTLGKIKILLSKLGLERFLEILERQKEPEKLIPVLLNMVFPSIKLIRAINGHSKNYRAPKDVYLNCDDLRMYFDDNPDTWFVDTSYPEDLKPLFKKLSVNDRPRVERKSKNDKGHVVIQDSHGSHKRGLNGFDPDIEVDGLKFAIEHPTLEKSEFIWNHVAIKNSDCIRGIVESSSRKTYEDSNKREEISHNFGRLLMDTPWLPDKQGNFHKPAELKLDDLPESFVRDEKLANQLGMKKNVVAKLAEEAGIPVEVIQKAKMFADVPPEIQKKIDSLLFQYDKRKPKFPQRIPTSPERRQERLAEQMNDAPEKEYEQRNRSVRTTKGAIDPILWLRNQYTNDAGQMICQICKEEMPFRKRDGEYYFEAVEALSRDHFAKEHEAQFLALCPLCAAMYNEFVKHDEGAMESLKNALINSEDAEVPLQLGELDTSVRFVESHFLDIRTIIEAQE
jgi:hypothetical protein